MNRADRRAEDRRIRRDLGQEGCRCIPTIAPVDESTAKAAGAQSGAYIRHERGCPLGDRVLAYNDRGIFPAMWVNRASGRCSR